MAQELIREKVALAERSKTHGAHPNMGRNWPAIKNIVERFDQDDGGLPRRPQPRSTNTPEDRAACGGTGFFSERLGSIARDTRQKIVSRDQDLSVR